LPLNVLLVIRRLPFVWIAPPVLPPSLPSNVLD